MMNEKLYRQFAADYCCLPEEAADRSNHFTEHAFLEGRRTWQEGPECFLKLAVFNSKLLFTGRKDIIEWCRNEFAESGPEWFLEAETLRRLDARLRPDGYQIDLIHLYYTTDRITPVNTDGYEIRWYCGEEIEPFRGDSRFGEAYAFCETAPDVIGVSAVLDGEILGMAGASCDSPLMRQIGINVCPGHRNAGIGTMLTALLKNRILEQGLLPYYGTSISHTASQRTAIGAGFHPAWTELVTSKIS